jgi:hypothetical protein
LTTIILTSKDTAFSRGGKDQERNQVNGESDCGRWRAALDRAVRESFLEVVTFEIR